MSDYFNLENDNTDRVLPYNCRPGTDLISRMVLNDNQSINMLIKVLVPEVEEDHYVATPTEFINRKKCDVLYAPHNPLSTFPPVFIEVQNQVDEKFLVRAIHYSTLIYERYKKRPILVIIGVASATAQFMSMTAPNSDFPFANHIPCIGWAKRCLVLTSSTLKVNEHNTDEELHPLQALGHFICSQSLSMSTLDYGKNDKWVKLLYSIAHANLKQLSGEEEEKLEAISNICSSSQIQLHKVKRCLENGDKVSIEKASSYVDDVLGFLQRQKRKYCETIETTPIEEAPPLVYLKKNRKLTNSVDFNDERNKTELHQFVQRFKSIESGRISWKKCFEQGYLDDVKIIKHFNTSESLRCHYNRFFK
ncbi:hypothetical protein HPULCUR_005401 [Helicostylum pulchrum]|uniref:Uncharacterized protein n=1 Tax=Helicostylum pulchrum TaxID=562976 RepID=A0ABP9XYY7_9FUNG